MIQLGEHFRTDDRSRHSDWLRQQHWFIKARHDQVRREEITEQLEEDFAAFATDVAMASQVRIAEFEARLDAYDEATVKALMENQKALDLVNTQLEEMLDRAYVLEDGRRVFKTEDCTQVFDEFGKEVTFSELDSDQITPDMPTWEQASPFFERKRQLELERTQIHEFQEKVDAARERVADGEIPEAELEELDAELAGAMPPSVKAHIPGSPVVENAPKAKEAFTTHANPTSPANTAPSAIVPQL